MALYSDFIDCLSLKTKTLGRMKHFILTMVWACIALQAYAQQSLSYAYDAAGNQKGESTP